MDDNLDLIGVYSSVNEGGLIDRRADSSYFAAPWSSVSSYAASAVVSRNGNAYRSLTGENVGNDPLTESEHWTKYGFYTFDNVSACSVMRTELLWKTEAVYGIGSIVIYEGVLYRCIANGTTGEWNPAKWESHEVSKSDNAIHGLVKTHGGITVSGGTVNLNWYGYSSMKGTDSGIAFAIDTNTVHATSRLVCDGSDVATDRNSLCGARTPFVQGNYPIGSKYIWYDGSLAENGIYVNNRYIMDSEQFVPSAWNRIDGLSSMYSSANVGIIRNVRAPSSGDVRIATICGMDVYAPMHRTPALVVTAVRDGYPRFEVNGETVYLYIFENNQWMLKEESAYRGQPVSFSVEMGRTYKVGISSLIEPVWRPNEQTVTIRSNVRVTLTYTMSNTYAQLAAALTDYPSDEAAAIALTGVTISDRCWNKEVNARVVDVRQYPDDNDVMHRGAVMMFVEDVFNKTVAFDTSSAEIVNLQTEPTAQPDTYYWGRKGYVISSLEVTAGSPLPTTYDTILKSWLSSDDYITRGYETLRCIGWPSYGISPIRQWLNSNAGPNKWFTKLKTGQSNPQPELANLSGFVCGCSNALMASVRTVAISAYDCCTDSVKEYHDRFWLPSGAELYGTCPTSSKLMETSFLYFKVADGKSSPHDGRSNARMSLGWGPWVRDSKLYSTTSHENFSRYVDYYDGALRYTNSSNPAGIFPCWVIW